MASTVGIPEAVSTVSRFVSVWDRYNSSSFPATQVKKRLFVRNYVSHVNIWKSNPRFFEVSETEGS